MLYYGKTTKYIYGLGLIAEDKSTIGLRVYHFDCRGSTVAITDANGNITDTFAYDTYGNLVSRTGTSKVIFLYNGRDGVITDDNGLYYMRARYYSPEMRRFINADIIPGEISNAVTLNRYAYANGNPVSNVDPFGLAVDEDRGSSSKPSSIVTEELTRFLNDYNLITGTVEFVINDDTRKALYQSLRNAILTAKRPNNIGKGIWAKQVANDLDWVDSVLGDSSKIAKSVKYGGIALDSIGVLLDTAVGISENIDNKEPLKYIISDAYVDIQYGAAGMAVGMAIGSIIPGAGTVAGAFLGAAIGIVVGIAFEHFTEKLEFNGKSLKDNAKETTRKNADFWDSLIPF